MRGVQRRAEARIGQLLGEAVPGTNQHSEPSVMTEGSIPRMDRADFRILARGLNGLALSEEDWRRVPIVHR